MTQAETTSEDALIRLAKLDTCAVSDALDRLNLRGAVLGIRPLWPCPRIVARCVTVKIKPAGLDRPKQHLCTPAIDAATAADAIVIDNGGRTDVAAWGGLLSLAAQVKGVRGALVDGACRDIDESQALQFPIYGRAAVQVTARGRIMQQSFNEEIAFAGVQVHPGDIVMADGSGVVFIPRAREREVISQAESLARREAQMADAIRGGRSVTDVMETMAYESMLVEERKNQP
jgi:4-hydroxy-4-methyl-2-oxoglutarate aldolase